MARGAALVGVVSEEEDRGDASRGVGEVLHLFDFHRASQDFGLPIGEPLFKNLIASEFVVPDGGGNIAPEGVVVQVNVKGGVAENGKNGARRLLFPPM